MRVKIFENTNIKDLEKEVDKFLDTYVYSCCRPEVCHVTQSSTEYTTVISIFYN